MEASSINAAFNEYLPDRAEVRERAAFDLLPLSDSNS